ncbi:MAG: hypothetical protein P4L16_06840 [Chlamydiales bacterium]|nr:hypothetical protein [Chlamydiales bacterium]
MYRHLLLILILTTTHLFSSPIPKEKAQLFKPFISTKIFRKIYASKLEAKFMEELPHASLKRLLMLYKAGYIFQKKPFLYKERILLHLTDTFQTLLGKNNSSLSQNLYLITLWKALNPSRNSILTLLNDLNKKSIELWALKRQFQKAKELTLFTSQLCKEYAPDFQSEIASMLLAAISYLNENNDVDALLMIYPICTSFNVHLPHLKQEIKNHIADAKCLFERGEYAKAEQWIKWALMIAPNEIAPLDLYTQTSSRIDF